LSAIRGIGGPDAAAWPAAVRWPVDPCVVIVGLGREGYDECNIRAASF
jgi:hypothetical protein